MWLVLCVLLVAVGSIGNGLTDEEYASFPRLFHLDDYEECLARRDGLFCLGEFHLTPLRLADHTFRLMLEYTADQLNFNRTIIHRGYCVNERCPLEQAKRPEGAEQTENAHKLRFEQCVDNWTTAQGYKAVTKAVQYCHTPEDKSRPLNLDTPKIVFIIVISIILFLNAVGTAYDVFTSGESKNELLMAWSVRSNAQRLFSLSANKDPNMTGLQRLQSVRVIIMVLELGLHVGFLHYRVYTHNSRDFEGMLRAPLVMLMRNGSALVEAFVVLSNFLLGFLLVQRGSEPLSLAILPLQLLKRFIRLTPVHLATVGFAATWWTTLGSGPMWATVETEAAICSRKFWTHPLYVYNFVEVEDQCVLPSWFLAVDMQLSLLVTALALALARWPWRALPTLTVLVLASILLNGSLAYHYQWTAALYYVSPENIRGRLVDVPSFQHYYMAPWGSLPASLIGLFLAHLYQHLQEKGFKASGHQWLAWVSVGSLVGLVALAASGLWLQHVAGRVAMAAITALERPLFSVLAAVCFFGLFTKVEFYIDWVFSWPVWIILGRLTLSVLMLHWIVILTFLAGNSLPVHFSYMNIVWETVAAVAITYTLAVPLTVLIETPFQLVFSAIIKYIPHD